MVKNQISENIFCLRKRIASTNGRSKFKTSALCFQTASLRLQELQTRILTSQIYESLYVDSVACDQRFQCDRNAAEAQLFRSNTFESEVFLSQKRVIIESRLHSVGCEDVDENNCL